MTHIDLLAVEQALEEEAVGLGIARYENRRSKHEEASLPPGKALVKKVILPLAGAISVVTQKKAGIKGSGASAFIGQFDPVDVAFITARTVVSSLGRDAKLSTIALAITDQLENAMHSAAFRKADPKGWQRLMNKVEKAPKPGMKYVLVKRAMDKAGITKIAWDKGTQMRVGAILVNLMAETSGLIDVLEVHRAGKSNVVVRAKRETMAALDKGHRDCALLSPMRFPMVVPPRPWETIYKGGYLDNLSLGVKLLGARHLNREYLEELKHTDMPMVYRAVNAVQATPWRVNSRVLAVMQEAWDRNLPVGKLPDREEQPIPEYPANSNKGDEAWKQANIRRRLAYDTNEQMVGKRAAFMRQLWIANKMQAFDAIYFPHVMDFRGRIYAVPADMNPQSDDTGRSLLEFANAAKLGDDGAFWLAAHGANTFGVDKVPFAERVEWVEKNQDSILASARDPLANRFWCDADGPWMFLAFCFEWADFVQHVWDGGVPEDFESSLPVSWDGSCNGLQNFSAMLRDPIGGAATNLIPSEKPADIYQRVADVASAKVAYDANGGEVNAAYWRGKVDRKIAKRPTMTLPYGSGRYGFRDQLVAELAQRRLDTGRNYLEGGDEFLCSLYLANVLHDALGKVVVAAVQAMDWLKEVAKIAAKDGLPLWWETPAGFHVMQEYKELIGCRVDIQLAQRRHALTYYVEGEKIDPRKQEQGIAPNFVHSLDAAHLMRTVSKCADAGVASFAMVHDSYGTHAGNATALHQMLREAFVEQYSGDVLADFRDQLAKQLPPELAAKLPPPPAMGELELTGVLQSEYFFA